MSPAHELALEPLTDTAWRLCDHAVPASDPGSLVAYVERRADGRYDVTWICHGVGTSVFATLGELFDHAADLLDDARPVRQGATKPIPIPHRPPLAAS